MNNESSISKILPVLFGFFVMGFVDLVGIATNYVKQDFALSDTLANLLPMTLFLWFAILSVPTGIVMSRLGRKKTAWNIPRERLRSRYNVGPGLLAP